MYGKIYEQTFTGSMYGSGSHIFALWSYVIAHTKPDAMVELNPIALASILGEEQSQIEQAIEHFKSPDPKSRSKEFEGRRLIQKGEFIYFVPQYHKYHGFANDKERREYFAQKKREQRQRDIERQTVKSKESKNVQQSDSVLSTQKHTETRVRAANNWLTEDDLWIELQKILPEKEVKEHVGMWITRIKENRGALYEAVCDFKDKRNQNKIKNLAAWLTQRYQHFKKLYEQRAFIREASEKLNR